MKIQPEIFIKPSDFNDYDTKTGIYPNLPDMISQEFPGGYFMSMRKYNWIKEHGLDI